MLFNARPAVIATSTNRFRSAAVSKTSRSVLEVWKCCGWCPVPPHTAALRFMRKSLFGILTLMAMAARFEAADTNTADASLVIGLLVPPEEPCAASLRDGATLGVEQANQSPGPRAL